MYDHPVQDLSKLAQKYRADQARAEKSRTALLAGIAENVREGQRRTDVARETGFTREYLRQLDRRRR